MGEVHYSGVLEAMRGNTLTNAINAGYPLTINFHTDRLTSDKRPILQALQQDGRLKSQFETATSNVGLSAFVGGNRWLWEHKAFTLLLAFMTTASQNNARFTVR